MLYFHLEMLVPELMEVFMNSGQLENNVFVAPSGQFRVVGQWSTGAIKPGQFFNHNDYPTIEAAFEVADELNEDLPLSDTGAFYFVYDDQGRRVQR